MTAQPLCVREDTLVVLSRYWHTTRYLKPVQLYRRVWFRLRRPTPDLRPAPARRAVALAWVLPARRRPSLVAAGRFCFLSQTHELQSGSWDDAALPKLWRYNLHYFDDLNAQDARSRTALHAALLVQWARENPPAAGSGWEPYPLSLRIVNWIKWALAGNVLPAECVHSLAVQVRHLVRRLEFHLLGNHLFVNAKALVFAGLFFEGEEAGKWLETGMSILARQVPEQILEDGGQFERSTMYHALALEDLLDLINLVRAFPDALPSARRPITSAWPALAGRMGEWLEAMCHPDGEIALFNDAAPGIAPVPAELRRYARDLGVSPNPGTPVAWYCGFKHLADSGYVRATAPDAVLIMDVAPVGPDYLTAHAHADTLSFELSLFGQRALVNGGTSRYGLGPEREAERGTPAHNTVTVNGQDSSEVWSGFRVARRAKPFDLRVALAAEGAAGTGGVRVTCAHDGYRRLPGRPVHRREWVLQPGMLRVVDTVEGRYVSAVARYLIHPQMVCEMAADASDGNLRMPGGQLVRWQVWGGQVSVEPGAYHPGFGVELKAHCLCVDFSQTGNARIEFAW